MSLGIDKASLLRSLGILYIVYIICLVTYRLYFSPLSKYPGPKLAACTRWYEFYYDVLLKGQFTLHIQQLHKQYGPLVRINPFELHIQDSSYWDELYTGHKDYERYRWIIGRFGVNTNTSTTVASHEHAARRAPLNPLFSKRSVAKLERVVLDKVDLLAHALGAAQKDGQVVVLNEAFNAFTGDVITTYCFGHCFDFLKSRDFKDNFHSAFEGVRRLAHLGLQFPSVFLMVGMAPDWLIEKAMPGVYMMRKLERSLRSEVAAVVDNGQTIEADHDVILYKLIESNLPASEKQVDRLTSEIRQLIGAGTETVAWALSTTLFHLLDKPITMTRLRCELEAAIPDPAVSLQPSKLEQLPYLTAVVREGLRLSTGVSVRLPRVSPTRSMRYGDWLIPAGIPVSMTSLDALRDKEVYADPNAFHPDRWLNKYKSDNPSINPIRGYVPFGKGPRMCLGLNLAYLELHVSLAVLVRYFSFELYDTDRTDVDIKHDFMVPSPKLDSKGIRVRVTSALR